MIQCAKYAVGFETFGNVFIKRLQTFFSCSKFLPL